MISNRVRECEKQQNFFAQNLKGVIWVGCLFIFRDKGLLAVCLGGGKFKARDEETSGTRDTTEEAITILVDDV